ncbi:hypothetical protein LMG28138_05871 [Pararobbsia alpina]|uniref:Uncharacterized protein n=1 Tax=Pararobbsia alpina TaxID=621374 RepID=A0A6S7CDK4_9BURK|nr:hypothetical protein LMG28138_05871 [Pararobbsia alpina]
MCYSAQIPADYRKYVRIFWLHLCNAKPLSASFAIAAGVA